MRSRIPTAFVGGAFGRGLLAVVVVLGLLPVLAAPVAAESEMARVARVNGRTEKQIERILRDPQAKVGPGGRLLHVDPAPLADPASAAAGVAEASPFPHADTFRLHSRPGSKRVIYLDFDGGTVAGTAWNEYFGRPVIDAVGYNRDFSPELSAAEHDDIQSIWQRVSEDFAVFDVDVTTEDPGGAAITRSGESDELFGARALVTNSSLGCGCGGIAYVGVFNEPQTHAFYQPAFVLSGALSSPKSVAEAVSHEVGHNLDLLHDGTRTSSYYGGHGSWAPIMGSSYSRPISQWSRGEYTGANNTEDDLAIIDGSEAELVGDDHGDTPASATALELPDVSTSGLITTDDDVDAFLVRGVPGGTTFRATPAPTGPNLDVRLELRSPDGTVVASSDPPSVMVSSGRATGMDASVSVPPDGGGDQLLLVSGVGTATPSTGYSGYASLGRYRLTATLNQPTVGLVSSANPVELGQAVTFTATVTAPPGSGAATGTVTFNRGGTALCVAVPLTGDQAACTATLDAGSHGVAAVYDGDAAHSAATSPVLVQSVDGDPVTVTVTSSPNPSLPGQLVTFQATVSASEPGAGSPTGTVTFRAGTVVMCEGVAVAAGLATCARSLPEGRHVVTAAYGGNARFNAGTSPALTQTVSRVPVQVTLTSSRNPALTGESVTLTATVAAVSGAPTGTVTFYDGGMLCQSAISGGAASCSRSFITGNHSLTAWYSGSEEFSSATSMPLSLAVVQASTTVTVTSSPNPSAGVGEMVIFQAKITPGAGARSPTGWVDFFAGPVLMCAVHMSSISYSDGSVPCPRFMTATGSHVVTVVYKGDEYHSGSTSPPLTHIVGLPTASVALTSSSNPSMTGLPVTLRAAVTTTTTGFGVPTGSVTFNDGSTVLCGNALLVLGAATCTMPLGPGGHDLTATYSGDAVFTAVTSAPVAQQVGEAATVTMTSSLSPSRFGQPIALRARVGPQVAGVGVPTGTVTFNTPTGFWCKDVTLVAGEAACHVAPPVGTRPVTAVYNGDDRFLPATSPSLSQTVTPAITTMAVTSSSNPVRVGQPVTLTARLSVEGPGDVAPAGTITFKDGPTVLCLVALTGTTADCQPTLPPGTRPITATYSGETRFLPATSPVHDQMVLPPGDTFVAMTPTRLLDTRVGIGGPATPVGPRSTRNLEVRGGAIGVPATATAVVVNVTATGATAGSYLTVYPSDVPQPSASNLNFVADQTIPNLVMTGIGADGRISIFNLAGSVHVLADVVGYYTPVGGSTFTAVTPKRLLDSRAGTAFGPGEARELAGRGAGTGVPDDATAVVVNTTVTGPTMPGYLTVYPAGVVRPNASNLNFVAGETTPNLVVVGLGTGGRMALFNAIGRAHVLVDVVGYFAPSGGSRFTAVPATRVLDTRTGTGGPATPIGAGGVLEVVVRGAAGVPVDATAVVMNVTVAFPTATSYLTVYPSGVARPNASNLNFTAGQIVPNLVVVGLGADGKVNLFNQAGSVHTVADIVGYTT